MMLAYRRVQIPIFHHSSLLCCPQVPTISILPIYAEASYMYICRRNFWQKVKKKAESNQSNKGLTTQDEETYCLVIPFASAATIILWKRKKLVWSWNWYEINLMARGNHIHLPHAYWKKGQEGEHDIAKMDGRKMLKERLGRRRRNEWMLYMWCCWPCAWMSIVEQN